MPSLLKRIVKYLIHIVVSGQWLYTHDTAFASQFANPSCIFNRRATNITL